jgi:hypothetical protein
MGKKEFIMTKIKDLVVATSKYMKDGKERNRYLNIGSLMRDDNGGEFILLNRTFNPAGVANPDNRDSVLVSMFDVKPRDNSGQDPVF